MGRRGRLPDPTSKFTQAALARAASLGMSNKTTPPAKVSMPASLKPRKLAVAFWNKHADGLIAVGRLRPELAESFAMLCKVYDDCQQLEQLVSEEGWTAAGGISPAARLLLNSRRDFVSFSKEFGLTAASWGRIPPELNAEHGEEDDEEAKLRAFTG